MFRLAIVLLVAIAGSGVPATADLSGIARRTVGKPVEDAVVWLDAPRKGRPAKPADAILTQRDIQFFPRVLVVEVGTKVRFPNADRVFHNVFSFHDGKTFDLGMYPVGTVKDELFDRPGLSRVFCNIHPQMAAYVMVVDTPYFAVSDQAGRFSIAGVPNGHYRYHAWRPGGAILDDDVDVGGDEPFVVKWP